MIADLLHLLEPFESKRAFWSPEQTIISLNESDETLLSNGKGRRQATSRVSQSLSTATYALATWSLVGPMNTSVMPYAS
jgi:hypothetical protein